MDEIRGFWQLVEEARAARPSGTGIPAQQAIPSATVVDPGSAPDLDLDADTDAVAGAAVALLARRDADEIVAAQRALWALMAQSYRSSLWAAAYLINGGCSDDGFDYFRAWLILQGRETFERVVADPDALAELPAVRAAAAHREDLDGEEALSIAWRAHIAATGAELPPGSFSVRYPELDQAWNFDFDDMVEMRRRLPRLTALYAG